MLLQEVERVRAHVPARRAIPGDRAAGRRERVKCSLELVTLFVFRQQRWAGVGVAVYTDLVSGVDDRGDRGAMK